MHYSINDVLHLLDQISEAWKFNDKRLMEQCISEIPDIKKSIGRFIAEEKNN